MAALVRATPAAALGLATGATPTGVYRELVRLVRAGALDLSRARFFNLDEYLGVAPGDRRSFRAWMHAHLFDPCGIPPSHTHFPDGWGDAGPVAADALASRCAAFEERIREAGGIDLQLLGIGRNGHIGFNEPGSTRDSRTRLVQLAASTRRDASALWGGFPQVPTHALTMGVGTILEARRLRVLAFGVGKRPIVARTITSAPDSGWPVSLLHGHPDVELIVDRAASGS